VVRLILNFAAVILWQAFENICFVKPKIQSEWKIYRVVFSKIELQTNETTVARGNFVPSGNIMYMIRLFRWFSEVSKILLSLLIQTKDRTRKHAQHIHRALASMPH